MSVIAFDGTIIAADRMMSVGDSPRRAVKLMKYGEKIVGVTGNLCEGLVMVDWYLAGAHKSDWPTSQQESNERWARLVVIEQGRLFTYERTYKPIMNHDKFVAYGSGSDPAMGALHAGMDAIRAVKIASLCNINCGLGVDWFNVITGESGQED